MRRNGSGVSYLILLCTQTCARTLMGRAAVSVCLFMCGSRAVALLQGQREETMGMQHIIGVAQVGL